MAEKRPQTARWIAGAIAVTLVGFIALLAVSGGEALGRSNRLLGEPVPSVAGDTLDGGSYDIADAGDRWVLVNFFATWCAGCIAEHPELLRFEEWANETGQAEMVAVVFNDPAERVEQFFGENGGDWPVIDTPSVPVSFQVSQIPETFLVSPDGIVVQHIAGEVQADTLIQTIEASS